MEVAAFLRTLSYVDVVHQEPEAASVRLGLTMVRAQIAWTEKEGRVADVHVTGELPESDSAARTTLKPQRGLANVEAAVHEIHVDDAAVDAAWVIHGDEPALLVAALPELRALAPLAPSIVFEKTKLEVELAHATVDVEAAIGGALALWHRAVFFRMGVS